MNIAEIADMAGVSKAAVSRYFNNGYISEEKKKAIWGAGGLADNFVTVAFTAASGYEKTGELLKKCGQLDGLICATDTMAAGAMQYLREHGGKAPEQILIAGQGDSDMARVMSPPLITVHYSYEKSGEIAVRMLMELLGKGEGAVKEVKLEYYIVDPEADQDKIQ